VKIKITRDLQTAWRIKAQRKPHSTFLFLKASRLTTDETFRLPEPHQREAMDKKSWKTTTHELRFVLGYVNQAVSCIAQFAYTQIGPRPDLHSKYGVAQAMYA
jgi:hypothetical protein